ncbi:MAG: transpeptidase family protein [Bacteroidales bacterium]|nr:transpeptidase family protein [Bacteroidales bacterium]
MTDKRRIYWKAVFVLICFIILMVGVVVKIILLHLNTPQEELDKISIKYKAIPPKRGDIYSSDGKLLASSVSYFDTYLDLACPSVKMMSDSLFDAEIDSLSYCLANLFGDKSKETYRSEIRAAKNKGSRCYVIKRRVNYLQYEKMRKMPFLRRGKYKSGFYTTEISQREKPFGMLARRTIGDNSSKGRYGLELCYDSILAGKEGYALFQKVSRDVWIPIETQARYEGDERYVEPEDGKDLITTLDISLQDIAETELEHQMKEYCAEFGTVVVMEVKTGKVRAIANLKRDSASNICYENYNYAIGNLPSGEASDPGSTFKVASLVVAMEDGYITPETMVYVGNGSATYYNKTITDSHAPDSSWISVARIIETSSNVGTARFVYDNYKSQQQKFVDGLKRLHLHELLGLELVGEAKPVIHEPAEGSKFWSGISLPQMAYGYELSIAPIQILAFYNAIANDGKLVRPMFVEALSYRGEIVETFEPVVIDKQICSKKTIDAVKKMLEGVVQRGTAQNLKNENYKIAGKTGTAQMNYGRGGKISYHASFVGYFPADNPEYSCIVSIYNPSRGSFYGNVVAGNVVRKIADKIYSTDTKAIANEVNPEVYFPYCKSGSREKIQTVCNALDLRTNIDNFHTVKWVKYENSENNKLNFEPYTPESNSYIPNVRNMSVADAIKILEDAGMVVSFSGRGKVIDQCPKAGTVFAKGDKIYLTLK